MEKCPQPRSGWWFMYSRPQADIFQAPGPAREADWAHQHSSSPDTGSKVSDGNRGELGWPRGWLAPPMRAISCLKGGRLISRGGPAHSLCVWGLLLTPRVLGGKRRGRRRRQISREEKANPDVARLNPATG